MVAITPVIGESLQKILIGGADYGYHTLTRFFALHAGVLPGLLNPIDSRPHIFVQTPRYQGEETFSKSRHAILAEQVFRDLVAALAVMAAIIGLVL